MSDPAGARVEWLTITGDPDVWRSIGLTIDADGFVPLFGTSLRILAPDSPADPGAGGPGGGPVPTGIVGWALSGVDAPSSVDGLPTETVERRPPTYAGHELGAAAVDHVVVTTDDLERTSAAITAATGCELRRIRELGSMRQGFHRIGRGGLIAELVERADAPSGPARFWGVVLIVDDLDVACARIGADRISPPKDAVQPGRRIATVRDTVGLGLPLALMTPDLR
jgi:predicted enzyme related to lactoylglutathione lyase